MFEEFFKQKRKPIRQKKKLPRRIDIKKVIVFQGLVGILLTNNLYIPPIVNNNTKIVLPKYCEKTLDPELFPEVQFRPYGRD